MKILNNIIKYLSSVLSSVLYILIYEYISTFLDPNDLLPSTIEIIKKFPLILEDRIYSNIILSIETYLISLILIGTITTLICTMILLTRKTSKIIENFLIYIKSIPPIAWFPIFSLWFGFNRFSILIITVFSLSSLSISNIINKVSDPQSQKKINILKSLKINMIKDYYFQRVLGLLYKDMGNILSLNLIVVVALEMFINTDGLGHILLQSREYYNIDEHIFLLFLLGMLGYFINNLFTKTINTELK